MVKTMRPTVGFFIWSHPDADFSSELGELKKKTYFFSPHQTLMTSCDRGLPSITPKRVGFEAANKTSSKRLNWYTHSTVFKSLPNIISE